MSKNIYFANVDKNTVENINIILDVIFAQTYESNTLYNEGKKLTSELAEVNKETDPDKWESLNNAIRVNGYKKKIVVAWRKSMLYDTKDEGGKSYILGLYSKIGVNSDLLDKYEECADAGKWTAWNKHIKTMLNDVYGMHIKDDKLVSKFASYLEHAIGLECSGRKDILKGKLLKDSKSFNKFAETFVRAIATYMATSCQDINIPTAEKYFAVFQYDKHWKNVEDWDVLPTIDDLEEIEEETTANSAN